MTAPIIILACSQAKHYQNADLDLLEASAGQPLLYRPHRMERCGRCIDEVQEIIRSGLDVCCSHIRCREAATEHKAKQHVSGASKHYNLQD